MTKYNLTDESKFEITGKDFMEQFTLVITVKVILLSCLFGRNTCKFVRGGSLCMICMVNPPIKPVDVFE
jgi:hypothetical protein